MCAEAGIEARGTAELLRYNSSVRYRYLGGELLYEYDFRPYDENVQKALRSYGSGLQLNFVDASQFVMAEATIPLDSLTRIIGADGKPSGWSYRSSIVVSEERYKQIAFVTPIWSYSDTLRATLRAYSEREERRKTRLQQNNPPKDGA